MAWFEASNHSEAVVPADRKEVWAALTDPDLLPRLTPFLRHIEVDGDHWRWELAKVPILTTSLTPSFTELMTFTEPTRIEWTHDPRGRHERVGVEGCYMLEEAPGGGTHLEITIGVKADLPLSRYASPAVTAAMRTVLAGMGKRFGDNLLRHLDTH
ncbi:MAG TPA: SRPBCC family protein [Marmoricola sp.]|jgi:carbon monoxide dehydrogenase subunit G